LSRSRFSDVSRGADRTSACPRSTDRATSPIHRPARHHAAGHAAGRALQRCKASRSRHWARLCGALKLHSSVGTRPAQFPECRGVDPRSPNRSQSARQLESYRRDIGGRTQLIADAPTPEELLRGKLERLIQETLDLQLRCEHIDLGLLLMIGGAAAASTRSTGGCEARTVAGDGSGNARERRGNS
jgi:hypothetical protein